MNYVAPIALALLAIVVTVCIAALTAGVIELLEAIADHRRAQANGVMHYAGITEYIDDED